VDAQGSNQFDFAAGPVSQGLSYALGKPSRAADQPRQDCKTDYEEGADADKKPFPRELARLHADLSHPFGVA
jgi:hypothetical protein